jgi:hypothetical protein
MDEPVLAAIFRVAIQQFRANVFVTQMLLAFNAEPQVWRVLCNELDPMALDTVFSTDMPKKMACEMVNITEANAKPAQQQSNPAEFSFSRMLRVNGELLGGAARASFSSTSALREACNLVGQSHEVHTRLELLDVSWWDFHRSLCGPLWTNWLTSWLADWLTWGPPTPETIWREMELAMVNVFAQSLWLSGSSKAYRKLICEGHNHDDGKLLAFNRSALVALGMADRHLDRAMGERCSAVPGT